MLPLPFFLRQKNAARRFYFHRTCSFQRLNAQTKTLFSSSSREVWNYCLTSREKRLILRCVTAAWGQLTSFSRFLFFFFLLMRGLRDRRHFGSAPGLHQRSSTLHKEPLLKQNIQFVETNKKCLQLQYCVYTVYIKLYKNIYIWYTYSYFMSPL